MTLLEKIKEICRARKISIRSVETACGLSNGTITKWDRHSPTMDSLSKVANYLGVTVAYLSGETDSVPINGQYDVYYLNREAAIKAQLAYEKYGLLFDAAEGSKPEDIQMAVDLLNRLKATNPDG